MKAYATGTMKYWLIGVIMLSLMVGWSVVPAFAASGETVNVEVPYSLMYDANSNRTGDTFTYQIRPVGGAPAIQGSDNGVYRFKIEADSSGKAINGSVDLKIAFSKPGEYKYTVSAYVPEKEDGFTYDTQVYTLNVYVKNKSGGGLKAVATLTNEDGFKSESLQFNPKYEETGTTRPITTPEGEPTDPTNPGKPDNPKNPTKPSDSKNPTKQNDPNNPAAPGNTNTPGTPGGGGNGNNGGATGNGGILGTGIGPTDGKLVDDDAPFADIINNAVPKANPQREYCSLPDLLLTLGAIILCIILLARYFQRIDSEEDEFIIRREGKLRLLGIIPAMVAMWIVLFTQDLGDPMKFYADEWTLALTVCFLANVGVAVLANRLHQTKEAAQQ